MEQEAEKEQRLKDFAGYQAKAALRREPPLGVLALLTSEIP